MYLTKEKTDMTLYKGYKPKFSRHQDVEVQVYVANIIGNDISKSMKTTVASMSTMIAQGFARGNK